jgi:hypothetical protein
VGGAEQPAASCVRERKPGWGEAGQKRVSARAPGPDFKIFLFSFLPNIHSVFNKACWDVIYGFFVFNIAAVPGQGCPARGERRKKL